MSDDGKTAKSQQPEGQTRGDLADAPNFQQTLKPGQGVNMTEWQPIETAPTEHILLYGSTRHDAGVIFSGWKAVNGRFYSDGGSLVHPTHWMPLPEPPHD